LATVNGNVRDKVFNVGDNVVNIIVTAEDGTSGTYTVTIHRLSNDATLKNLELSAGDLSFDANTTAYTVNVSNDVTGINVNGTANHSAATVNGNVSGKTLEIGDNVIEITVTAEDGTTMTYTLRIVRADHVFVPEANLLGIIANGNEITVTGNTIEYAAPCGETSFALDLQASPNSIISIDGEEYVAGQSIEFAGKTATANIQVTAETGGTVSNYILNINAPLNDGRLYYKRWDDVLAINRNPANNGGYNVSEIRWYRQDGAPAGNEGYITIPQGSTASDYYAEIRTDGKVRRACNVSETRALDKIIAYPNPVPRGETLQLKLPETFVGGVLNIYDIKGGLLKSGLPLPATDNSVNVSDLDSGIYLLSVTGRDGNRQVIKLIIE
jgi:hypothetical protein